MIDAIMSLPVWVSGLLGSLLAGLCTGLGALPILLRAQWSVRAQGLMLAAAAGVMLGATVFSLVLPCLDIVEARTGSAFYATIVAGGGIVLGAVCVWLIHSLVPHKHFVKGHEGGKADLGRHWLFILAITLHNFPEGMSVGVAYGDPAAGLSVTLGIALQNLPEGLAVAAALVSDGVGRARALWLALLTGLVEPVGGLLGALAVSATAAALPWGLACAGGAMLFVISGEVIPETHRQGAERGATLALVLGFVVMMVLDVALT